MELRKIKSRPEIIKRKERKAKIKTFLLIICIVILTSWIITKIF